MKKFKVHLTVDLRRKFHLVKEVYADTRREAGRLAVKMETETQKHLWPGPKWISVAEIESEEVRNVDL